MVPKMERETGEQRNRRLYHAAILSHGQRSHCRVFAVLEQEDIDVLKAREVLEPSCRDLATNESRVQGWIDRSLRSRSVGPGDDASRVYIPGLVAILNPSLQHGQCWTR